MKITIVSTAGQPQPLHVAADATVAEVKAKWQELYGVGWYYQRLVYGGQQLYDQATLQEYSISDGARLWQALPLCDQGNSSCSVQVECQVCLEECDAARMAVLQPCGHAGVCRDCAAPLAACPFCRAALQ
jgi:hypothetical protein